MKTNYLLLGIITLFSACAQEEFNDPKTGAEIQKNENMLLESDHNAIHFNNTEHFFACYDSLLTKDYDEQLAWSVSRTSNSLLKNADSCTDTIMLSMPKEFQALFNKELEVAINDSILKYDNGNIYLTAINKKGLFPPILCGETNVAPIENEVQTRMQSGDLEFRTIGFSHQYNFKRASSKYKFNYVNELKSYQARVNNIVSEVLGFMVKLEYRGRGSWKEASEPRDISMNIDCGASIFGIAPPITHFTIGKREYKNRQWNLEIPVAKVAYTSQLTRHVWYITISGSISQTISGENETKWTNTY